MSTILVAAGGGGDAITCAAIAAALGIAPPTVILTYSWDRLMIDPLPGPRSATDFTGLRRLAPLVNEVVEETTPIPPAGSSLPRLSGMLPARVLLLDPSGGAVGMARQITAAAKHFDANDLILVDVGGDALTSGADPGLRSPLADQLALAACFRTNLPARLVIAAPGIDGELDPSVIHQRLTEMSAMRLPSLTARDLDSIRRIFAWHPSEASGLLAAAADGHRGRVEVRDAGDQVHLTDETSSLHAVDTKHLIHRVPAGRLVDSCSLREAEMTLRRLTGISELEYETAKAARRNGARPHVVTTDDLQTVDRHAFEAFQRGAHYISMRRISELVGATTLETFAHLNRILARSRPDRYATSLYAVR